MTTIVGLDLSLTSAGVAAVSDICGSNAGVAWPFVLETCGRDGRRGEDWQKRSRRVRKQVRDVLTLVELAGSPDLVVIEGPITQGQMLPSYFDRAILFGGVYGALDARDIPIAVISPTTGHQFTTGKGSMPKSPELLKPTILAAVRKMVPEVPISCHDVADALGYAFMGAMSLGIKTPWRPQRWQYEAVHTAVWPHGRPVMAHA